MPPPPPLAEVVEKLQTLLVPAAAGGALGMVLVLALSKRLAWFAAALGAIGGVAFANWDQDFFPWQLGERSYELLVPAAFFLVVVGVVSEPLTWLTWRPRLVLLLIWLLRIGETIYALTWLTPEWPDRLALAGTVTLHWAILDLVSRPRFLESGQPLPRGNRSAQILLLQSLALTLAGGLVLYAHSLRLSDLLSLAGAATFSVALAGYAAHADVRGAIPLGALLLPGVLFVTHETTTSLVPITAYALAATAPLALVAWLIPALTRRDGWAGATLRVGVMLALAGAALILAGQVELLPWEEEW